MTTPTPHPLAELARAAAAEVRPGMTLGLGTGSTAEAVLREIGRRVAEGLVVSGVPTSRRSELVARTFGITICSLDANDRLDLGIDGADEIDQSLNATKGHGNALLHEKLVALACDDYLLVAAAEKRVERLGSRVTLPVEVIPFGWRQTADRLAALGFPATLRLGDDGQARRTDGGHYTLDCTTGPLDDPAAVAAAIKAITGVVDHGLFVGLARRAFLAEPDGTITRLERPSG